MTDFDFKRNAAGEIVRADLIYVENGGTRVHSVGGWGLGQVLLIGAGRALGLTPWKIACLLSDDDVRYVASL